MRSFSKTVLSGLVGLGMLGTQAEAEPFYNPTKSSVMNLNNKNFEKQVTLNRDKGISIVQYYKASGKNRFIFGSQLSPRLMSAS